MAEKRIYSIKDEDGDVVALVNAQNKAQASAHYASRTISVGVAEPQELIAATKCGIEVEEAGA